MPATKKQIGIGVGIAVAVLAVGGLAVATLLSALSTPTTIAEPKPIHSSSSPSGSSTPGSTGTSKATPAPRASSPGANPGTGTNPGGGNLIDNYLDGGGDSTTPGGNRVVPVEVIPGGGNQSVVIAPPVVNPVDQSTNPGGNTGGEDNGNGGNTGGGDNGGGGTGGGDNGGNTGGGDNGGGDNGGGTVPTPNPTPTPDPTPTTDPVVTTQKAFLERYGENPEGKPGFTRGDLISSEEIAPLVAATTSMPKFPDLTDEQKAAGYEVGWVIEPGVDDPTKVKVSWYLYSPPAGEEPKSTIEQAEIAYQAVVNKAYNVEDTDVKNHFGEPGYRCSLTSYGWGTQPSTVAPPKGIPIDSLGWNLRLSLNGENWNVEWYTCEPDEVTVESASALSAPSPTEYLRF